MKAASFFMAFVLMVYGMVALEEGAYVFAFFMVAGCLGLGIYGLRRKEIFNESNTETEQEIREMAETEETRCEHLSKGGC